MKTNLERWIHLNMALIGGFIGGFAILNHVDLFSSAQTANMISIAMQVAGRDRTDMLVRFIGVLVYMAGLASTVVIPRCTKWNMKIVSVSVDAVAIIVVGFLPASTNHFIALYPLFLATSIQWCSFTGAEGYVTSSIFSTNNLRQFTTSLTDYLMTRNPQMLRKAKLYGKVLLSFHVGVAIAYLSCQAFGLHGAWVCLLPISLAGFLVLVQSNVVPHLALFRSMAGRLLYNAGHKVA
jgi:uncharacterized membrane protein YoaK (UPF0700 family)